jgi:hypothetical protein
MPFEFERFAGLAFIAWGVYAAVIGIAPAALFPAVWISFYCSTP